MLKMCYTAKDSLNAYLINLIFSIIILKISNNNLVRLLCIFFLFVGQMQLFDYLFWINKSCNKINKYITKLAIIFNHLQPIILVFLLYFYGYKTNPLLLLFFILYLLMSIPYNYNVLKNINCTLPVNNNIIGDNETYMMWKWNNGKWNGIYYFLFLSILVLVGFTLPNRIIGLLFSFISILSFIIATKTPILNISIGRIWCYYASLFPILLILLIILFPKTFN